MTNFELQVLLQQYPDDIEIRHIPDTKSGEIIEFTDENILHTSETAHVDRDAKEDDWDTEDGKIELGDGKQYLLINPIIY